MDIQIGQEAKRRSHGSWDWSIWLEGSDEDLDQVASAEYVLHPTFPNPVQEVSNRANSFRLDARGWGEFLIHVNIHLQDGTTLKHEHWLKLRDALAETQAKGAAEFSFDIPEPQRRVYLSFSLADLQLAEKIGEALRQYSIKVLMSVDFDPSLTLDRALSLELEPINGAIFIITDIRSPYMPYEIQVMRQNDITILPVLVGPKAKLPEEFTGLNSIHVEESGELEGIAMSVIDQFKL